VVTVSARREVVCFLRDQKRLSERRALAVMGMSASVLRYALRPDGNGELRSRVLDLAHRHRRHGYRMIHMRLRLEGWPVNVKRVYRLYREENLMVRRRRRRKLPQLERQPFGRPAAPNEVWSMDFLFDEISDGRRMKCLAIVGDCSKESVGLEADTSIPGCGPQILDRRCSDRPNAPGISYGMIGAWFRCSKSPVSCWRMCCGSSSWHCGLRAPSPLRTCFCAGNSRCTWSAA
jgi:transposase InsO family protein